MTQTVELPQEFGEIYGRRIRRSERTVVLTEAVRHKRRAFIVRAGILVGFALAMVVYPVRGTLSPTATAVESLPGVVLGDAPLTAEVLMGEAPTLLASELPPPSIDDTARSIALNTDIVTSSRLPGCSGEVLDIGTNGNVPEASLCQIWDGKVLRADAAVALAELNHRFRLEFGRNICLSSTYRTYGDQVRVKQKRGYLAATPGTSNHGWGLAVDVCRSDYQGAVGDWLKANAGAYGWENPKWARTVLREPWHYEFAQGRSTLPEGIGSAGAGDGELYDDEV